MDIESHYPSALKTSISIAYIASLIMINMCRFLFTEMSFAFVSKEYLCRICNSWFTVVFFIKHYEYVIPMASDLHSF